MADNSIHTLKLLKFFLMFDCTTFDHTFSGKLNPSLVNFKNSLIASGIAPYFTYPHENKLIPGRIDSVEKLNVCFLFNEPLCKRITESIFSKPKVKSKINIDDDAFWQSNFLALVPKENEKNERFDAAFSIILAYLSNKKKEIGKLPFMTLNTMPAGGSSSDTNDGTLDSQLQTNFKRHFEKFSKSKCIFTVTTFISSDSIKTWLSSLLNKKEKVDDDARENLENILRIDKKR